MGTLSQFYESRARPLAEGRPSKVRKQIEQAFRAPPSGPDAVDAWFLEHLQRPPVSDDPRLLGELAGLKAALRDAL